MSDTATYKIDRTHEFPNGAMCSVFVSGAPGRLIAHRVNWHGHRPPILAGQEKAFWDEFETFYAGVMKEAQSHIGAEAMHSDEALAIIYPDRAYSLKRA